MKTTLNIDDRAMRRLREAAATTRRRGGALVDVSNRAESSSAMDEP